MEQYKTICKYGTEPVDLKLLAIRLLNKLWVLLGAAVLGAFICGGCYFVKNVIFAPDASYVARSMMYIDFVQGNNQEPRYYTFNTAGWSGFVKTDEILDKAMEYLKENWTGSAISKEELRESVGASVDADYRVVDLQVTSNEPEKAVVIAHGIENAFLKFGESMKEIENVRVMTSALGAERVLLDVAVYRAVIWGAVIGMALAFLSLLTGAFLDDSIYIPATAEHRYGVKMLGAFFEFKKDEEQEQNKDFLEKRKREVMENDKLSGDKQAEVGIFTGAGDILPALTENQRLCIGNREIPLLENLLEHPENIGALSRYKEVLLVIPAGAHNGKQIEYAIEQVTKAGGHIGAGLLVRADVKLWKQYYKEWLLNMKRGGS